MGAGKHLVSLLVFTISGTYRDGFGDKLLLLDKAARLAASAEDNALSRHHNQIEAALVLPY